jgi:hypothetical protein
MERRFSLKEVGDDLDDGAGEAEADAELGDPEDRTEVGIESYGIRMKKLSSRRAAVGAVHDGSG